MYNIRWIWWYLGHFIILCVELVCMFEWLLNHILTSTSIKFLLTYILTNEKLRNSIIIALKFVPCWLQITIHANIGLAAWQHQAITWSKVDLSSKVFCDIYPDIYVKTTAMEFYRAVILKSMLYSHIDIIYCINANKFQHFLIEIQHVSCSWKLRSSASWRPLFSVSMIKKISER